MAHKTKKHRVRGSRGTSYKMMGFAALAGIAAVVGAGYAETKIDYVRQHWYAAPIALGIGGLVLARRMPIIAVSLFAVAGALGYAGYSANQLAQGNAAPPKAAAGLTDAGAYGGWRQGARMGARRDSGLYEAGALMGAARRPLISQQSGALMGPVGAQLFRDQGAGALFAQPIEGG